ncbi:MAG: hypothetical protein Q9219_005419 [cf. Caloplaca sp. 3 TL-2023]
MSHPPPLPPVITSVTSSAQPAYISQLPLGTSSEDILLASQSQAISQQQSPEQQQPPGPSNPRKRKAVESPTMTAMTSTPVSGYRPSTAYTAPAQQGEQPAEAATQATAPKKSRTNTPWSPAEEQRLKTMRDAGNSWSEIAKDMHYADFAADESEALLSAIKEYEASKWKVIGAKVGKPAKEGETKTVDLSCESLPMVERMMKYLYVLDYDGSGNYRKPIDPDLSCFEVNAQMYAMGDRFGIPGLKQVAASKFSYWCEEIISWESDDSDLAESRKTLLESAETIYTSTPEEDSTLRHMVSDHFTPIGKWRRLPLFRRVCIEHLDFLRSVLEMTEVKDSRWQKRWINAVCTLDDPKPSTGDGWA